MFLKWKEDEQDNAGFKLDKYLRKMCTMVRLIELMHDFVLFDGGGKKLPRVHQYFGIKAAQEHARQKKGGIIFGRKDVDNFDAFLKELRAQPSATVGEVFVFVDECHRTQSGKLHKVMKAMMPTAMFVGFTGTPMRSRGGGMLLQRRGPIPLQIDKVAPRSSRPRKSEEYL